MKRPDNIVLFLLRRLGIFALAVLLAYALATVSATLSVVWSLKGMSVEVPAGVALNMIGRDLAGMANMFLPMVAFGLLIALMTAALLFRIIGRWRTGLYMLAGATALVTIHVLLQLAFGITPLAVARSVAGLATQAIAGSLGGLLYSVLVWKQSSY